MKQGQKIQLMLAGIGLLLVGFVVLIFTLQGSKEETPEQPPVAGQPSAPPAGSPPEGMPAPPAGDPGMPAPPAAMPAAPPSGMNAGMTPIAPPVQPGIKDPFAGGPGRIIPPKPPKNPDNNNGTEYIPGQPDLIPLYEIPNVNTDGGAIRWETRTSVETKLRDAGISIGRNAGWIANDARGRVVAYFEMQDGSVRAATVDSVIEGYRVKAINLDQQYILLVNTQNGVEEKVTLQGARR